MCDTPPISPAARTPQTASAETPPPVTPVPLWPAQLLTHVVGQVAVGASLQQEVRHVHVAPVQRQVEGGSAAPVWDVQGGAGVQQTPHRLQVTPRRGTVQRRLVLLYRSQRSLQVSRGQTAQPADIRANIH